MFESTMDACLRVSFCARNAITREGHLSPPPLHYFYTPPEVNGITPLLRLRRIPRFLVSMVLSMSMQWYRQFIQLDSTTCSKNVKRQILTLRTMVRTCKAFVAGDSLL